MLRRRILFIILVTAFFLIAVLCTYVLGVEFPRTGISTRALGLVISTIDKIGYFGIFILMILESCGIPIPSEIIMPFSGYLVSMGRFNYWLVVLVGSLANLVGSVIAYLVGSVGRGFLDKYGKYLMIHRHHLEYAEKLFYRYGGKIVLLGRNMPVVRTYISFPAGISKMNFMKFCIYTFFGSIPWNMFLVYMGVWMGEHWSIVADFFERLDTIIIITAIMVVIYLLVFEAREEHEGV